MLPRLAKLGSRALGLLLLALGCAAQPRNVLVTGNEGAPGVATFLLCSPNLVIALPAELQGGIAPVQREIETYLRAGGRSVVGLNLYDGRLVWKRAVEQARREGDAGSAPAIFTRELAEHFEFQAVVMPSIIMHQTTISWSAGSWNGVSRRMRTVSSLERSVGSRGQDTLADGAAIGGAMGKADVLSLHVLVFSREGERIFEGFGGLDFIHGINLSRARSDSEVLLVLRSDLFDDPGILREGIGIAFAPYLTPPVEP
jgi:hypothetical protein